MIPDVDAQAEAEEAADQTGNASDSEALSEHFYGEPGADRGARAARRLGSNHGDLTQEMATTVGSCRFVQGHIIFKKKHVYMTILLKQLFVL